MCCGKRERAREHRRLQACLCGSSSGRRAAVPTAKEAWSPSDRLPYPHPTSTPHITSRLVYAPAYFERRHFARDDTAHAARAYSIDSDIAHPASEKATELGLESNRYISYSHHHIFTKSSQPANHSRKVLSIISYGEGPLLSRR
jgi:hypothetical protein